IFPANKKWEHTVLNLLPGRLWHLHPDQSSTWHGAICLRAEILGCALPDPNHIYPSEHTSGTNDKLDFRHHNYKELRKLMKNVSEACPDITRIYSIGKSYQGLNMYVMEISDNPGQHEVGEPEFRYVANMHGNEVLGRELVLNLMEYLCQEYKQGNPRVRRLVTETRIHLLPSMNPDGYEMAYKQVRGTVALWLRDGWLGYRRDTGIGLNGNFPDLNTELWDAEDAGLVPHNWMQRYPFVLSANMHGGELVVTYPFDMTRTRKYKELTPTPDDAIFRRLATIYATSNLAMVDNERRVCHYDDLMKEGNIINGAKWNSAPRGSYLHTNCFEVTIELSCDKFPHAVELPQEWENNKEALLLYMEQNNPTLCDFRLTKTPKLREILAKGGKVPKDPALRLHQLSLRQLRLRILQAQRQAH
ncbi:hypothetical protein E2320_007291, partial [Naja naja]